jgi:hypothetical protein
MIIQKLKRTCQKCKSVLIIDRPDGCLEIKCKEYGLRKWGR